MINRNGEMSGGTRIDMNNEADTEQLTHQTRPGYRQKCVESLLYSFNVLGIPYI